MKHTPGPWEVRASAGKVVVQPKGGGYAIATLHWQTDAKGNATYNAEANARLIAATPGLLEALEASESLLKRLRACNRDFVQEIDEACEQARAAIAKIRGKGNAST